MKYFLTLFFIIINFPVFSSVTLNGTYLICEKTPEYFVKEVDKINENYIFFFLKHNFYEQKKIIKIDKSNIVNYSFQLFNTGKYGFKEKTILFNDSLKFRKKAYKRELDRNTMMLQSKYKKILIFEHFCEVSDLSKFDNKHIEIINKLKKFWKNKYKDNKI